MFATIGHTFELMKMSWNVLMKDRELILFPVLSGLGPPYPRLRGTRGWRR